MKLDAIKFGLAGGIISAILTFALALGAAFAGVGGGLVDSLASLYVGYEATIVGGLIGALWAFVEGFVFFYMMAWLYAYLETRSA
jgi:hypothetical protein